MTQRTKPLRWWESLFCEVVDWIGIVFKGCLLGIGFTYGAFVCVGWLS